MSAVPVHIAHRAVRWWVALYTWRLPSELRASRRAEIESDLWEQQQDAALAGRTNREVARVTIHRFMRGILADVSWRAGTGDTVGQSVGLWFALSAILGFWLAFLNPGVPDLGGPAPALAAFYAGKEISVAIGHVLVWASAGIFLWFVLRLYRRVVDRQDGGRALPAIVLVSGIVGAAMLCLAFAFTGIASFYGGAGLDPSVTQRFFPLAGFTFHTVLSSAIAVFLAATTVVSVQTRFLSERTTWASGILALFLFLEAMGALMVFLVPQALFLAWVVVASLQVSRNRTTTVAWRGA